MNSRYRPMTPSRVATPASMNRCWRQVTQASLVHGTGRRRAPGAAAAGPDAPGADAAGPDAPGADAAGRPAGMALAAAGGVAEPCGLVVGVLMPALPFLC